MGNAYKREVKDWRGVVIGCDVGRFFPIEAHAAADHAEAALNNITVAAFVPALQAGPAFDSPEHSLQSVSANYTTEAVSGGVTMPPNCDGNAQFGHEATQAGYALAHAQHEAAVDGDECSSGACLLTRGSD